MHIVALVRDLDHVCCRYRIAAYRRHWEAAGHVLAIKIWPRYFLSRKLLRRQIGQPDVLILQRRMMTPWQYAMLRRLTGHLLFDFDDALFLRDSFYPRGIYSAKRARLFRYTVQVADLVIAGNWFLHDQAARWTEAHKLRMVPTCLDVERYPVADHLRGGATVRLAWIGSSSTLRGLEEIRPCLDRLGRQPGLCLRIICDRFLEFGALPLERRLWSEATEAADLAGADIGISWLPDDLWSRGKCGLKVLQYMAAGLPVIANPVGIQAELVRDGVNGLLVRTPGELEQAVRLLASSPDLRATMGRAGRQRVKTDFNLDVGVGHWNSILRQLGGEPVPPSVRSA